MENPKNIISSDNPQTNTQPPEHSEPQATSFIGKEFNQHYSAIYNQGLFKADEGMITWLASIVHNIKAGNYDALLPDDLSEIKHGAVLLYDDLNRNSDPQWVIADESSGYLTDDNRRNYIIHMVVPEFIEHIISIFAIPIQDMPPHPTARMNALLVIVNDLRDIARHNSDPNIPFEQRLDGNRNLWSHAPKQPLHCTPVRTSTAANPS